MPADQVQKAIDLANKIQGLTFLDVQVGQSTVQKEVPSLEAYLTLPTVMLAIDPEFAMEKNEVPGTLIGSFNAQKYNNSV